MSDSPAEMPPAEHRAGVKARLLQALRNVRPVALALPLGVVLFLAGLAWRFYLGPLGGLGFLDGREAMVSLMARAMQDGSWPGFHLWGTPHVGSIESPMTALFYAFWGHHWFFLRAVPFAATAFMLVVTVLMVAMWMGRREAILAMMACGILFPLPVMLLSRAQGGLATGVMVGMMSLCATSSVSILEPRKWSLASGLLCGIALFAHPALAPFLLGASTSAALGLMAVLTSPSRVLIGFNHGLRFLAGLAVTAAPLWLSGETPLFSLQTPPGGTQPPTMFGGLIEIFSSPWLALGVAVIVVLALLGAAVRLVCGGVEDRGARLSVACVTTALTSMMLTIAFPDAQDATLRTLPLFACLPVLAATSCQLRLVGFLSPLSVAVLVMGVDVGRIPTTAEPGHDLSVQPVVDYLVGHPDVNCYATPALAMRISELAPTPRHCVSVAGKDVLPQRRAETAAGRRAYFLAPENAALLKDMDSMLSAARVPHAVDVAGPFAVRLTDGLRWPPTVPEVIWEHGKREQRTTIDGNLTTSVVVRAGEALRMDLVWPTVLQGVKYWQDITALSAVPCRVRAGIKLANGQEAFGPVKDLGVNCQLARKWALLSPPSVEVYLPVPRKEAVAILLEVVDQDPVSALAASELRVVPPDPRNPLNGTAAVPLQHSRMDP